MLYKRIRVPEAFLREEEVDVRGDKTLLRYGGDIRVGDLTGNGTMDLLVYRCGAELKLCFMGAFDVHGKVLWQLGEGGVQPVRPGPVAVHDIDGDGRAEVICCFTRAKESTHISSWEDVELLVIDGATGRVKCATRPDVFRQCSGPWSAAPRVLIANFRGLDSPGDFLVRTELFYTAFDDRLQVLWAYRDDPAWNSYGKCPAYYPAVGDIDGDGCDEVNTGYFLIDQDGTLLWEKPFLAPYMDSVAIDEWEPGKNRAICSGFGHVVDEKGNVILCLGQDAVPHGQEVRVGRLAGNVPGQQMVIRCRGHEPDVLVTDCTGKILGSFKLNETTNNTGMEVVYWNGFSEPALICNGDFLWHASGSAAWRFEGLEEIPGNPEQLRMSWYHCIPADVCGDEREEVILYNPWGSCVYIYTPYPLKESAYRGYRPGPRAYNARLMN